MSGSRSVLPGIAWSSFPRTIALLLGLATIAAGCSLFGTTGHVQSMQISEGGATVFIDDPQSVLASLSVNQEPGTVLAEDPTVTNPNGDQTRLSVEWVSATCAPGGSLRLSRLANSDRWQLVERAMSSPADLAAPTKGPVASCAGAPVTVRLIARLRQPIDAAAIEVSRAE